MNPTLNPSVVALVTLADRYQRASRGAGFSIPLNPSVRAMCNEIARRIALGQTPRRLGGAQNPARLPRGLPQPRQRRQHPHHRSHARHPRRRRLHRRGCRAGGRGRRAPLELARPLGQAGLQLPLRRARLAQPAQGWPLPDPVDGFYEFTAPEDPKQKRKDKWLFASADHDWFCIAGLWRTDPNVGEAFTMLTCPPGPDIAPYHARQVVVLPRADWARWLDGSGDSQALCRPAPAGTFTVTRAA